MISPNYSILKPTVFVLTSIYAKVFEKRWRSQKGHVTSHQGQSIKNRSGTHGPPVPQIWCNSDYYLQSYGILKKNGTRNFSLIGCHLESVSRTIPVFKHTLAPSEKWPTQEISVRFGPFLSSYRVNIARCNLCARTKVKGHIKLKIEENTSVGKLVEPFQIW